MTTDTKRKNLGKGLSALLGEAGEDYARLDRIRAPRTVAIERLRPSPYQPRRRMAEDELADLARSIAEKGILQPILVRRAGDDPEAFEIIAGERRWRAAQRVQLHEVPVLVRELSDREALEIALVENLQRQDLTPLEEAEGYRRLMEEFTHTQEDLARSVGKSRSHVANMMRLLGLPEPVKALLDGGQLSAGHARALLGAADVSSLARQVVKRGLNVRQTERLVRHEAGPGRPPPQKAAKDIDTLALERDLSTLLGLSVEIRLRRGGGALILNYRSLDQLDDILQRLSHGNRSGLSDVKGAAHLVRDDVPIDARS
ncbi:MAG: ParB/RepB/Spo0J family partition protein [Rhodospirillales bacterium]